MTPVLDPTFVEAVTSEGFRDFTGSVGLAATLALVVLLAERTVMAVGLPEHRRGLVRALDAVIVPLAVVVFLVIVTRFQTIR